MRLFLYSYPLAFLMFMAVGMSSAHAAAPVLVQSASKEITKERKINRASFTTPNTAGNLIVVYHVLDNTDGVTTTDTAGNNYQTCGAKTVFNGGANMAQIDYAANIKAGTNTVQANYLTTTRKPGARFGRMFIHEFSGLDTSNPCLAATSAISTGTSINSGSVTATAKDQLVFGAITSSVGQPTVGSGFTSILSASMGLTQLKLSAASGAVSASATTPSGNNVAHVAVFKQADVVVPPTENTYYIDFKNGSDSNTGKTKTSPWKHHPAMKGWTGGNKYVASNSTDARFIFKGGVVWPSSALPLNISEGGTVSTNDYYGVDQTWFEGSAFARPILDAQGTSMNSIVTIWNNSNITLDNIELRDTVFTDNEGEGIITIGEAPKNILMKNLFIHKWTLASNIKLDDAHGGVIASTRNLPPDGVIIDSSVISNSEYSSTRNNGVAVRMVQTVRNSVIHDMPTAILYASYVHDNHIFNINYPKNDFDPNYHTNLVYMAANTSKPAVGRIYNNLIHDIGSGTGLYAEPCFFTLGTGNEDSSSKIHIYNNVVYNARNGGGGVILIDSEGGSGSCGEVRVFQNTLQVPDGVSIGMTRVIKNHNGTNSVGRVVIQNNHFIGNNGEWDTNFATSSLSTNNIQTLNKDALTAGYKVENLFRPTKSNGLTVNKGTNNIDCLLCTPEINKDYDDLIRPQGTSRDAGAHEYQE